MECPSSSLARGGSWGGARVASCRMKMDKGKRKIAHPLIHTYRETGKTKQHRYALRKKLRDYLGIFPKWRTPPPHPPLLGTPYSKKNFIVYFAF